MFLDGLEYYKKALYSEALQRWNTLYAIDPVYPNLSMFMNVCERRELSAQQELEILEKDSLKDISPDGVELLDSVGEARERFKDAMASADGESARALLAQLGVDRPSDISALKFQVEGYKQLSEPSKMVEAAKKILSLAPYSSETHLLLGKVFLYLEQPEEAITYFQNSIKLNPDGYQGYFRMGAAYLSLDKRREASEFLQKAIALNPKLEKAQKIASRVQTDMLELEKKILVSYEKLSEKNRYPDVLYRLGVLYRKIGQLEKAFQVLEEALELNSSYRDAKMEMARLQMDLNLFQEACDTLHSMVENKDEIRGYENIRQFIQSGYFEEAARELLRSMKLETDYGAVHIELGKEYVKVSQWDKALEELSRGIYLSPHYPDGHFYIGRCLEKQGRYSDALDCFLEALELNPMYIDASLSAAGVCIELGKNTQARKLLKGLMASSPPGTKALEQAKELLEKLS